MADDAAKYLFIPTRIKGGLKFAGLAHGHPAIKLVFLGEVTDACSGLRGKRLDIVAEDAALAASGSQQAEQHPDSGRFAGAIPAQECEHAAARHLEVEVIHGGSLAEVARQAARLDYRGVIRHFEPPPFEFFHLSSFLS